MKFKKLMTAFMAVAVMTTMVACGKADEAPQGEKQETSKLTLGVMGSIDSIPMVIAQEKGYFEELGLDVDLQIFKAAKDRDAALQAGELDGVLADEVAISIYQNSGIDMKITGTTSGYFTLVAGKDSGIESTKDLVGKKVGMSERTMMDYLVDYIEAENGLDDSDMGKVAIPVMPARLEALNNNQIDAAILPAPFSDSAIANGGKELVKIENKDIMLSTTAFSQNTLDENKNAVQKFYDALDKAIEYMNKTDISEYEDTVISTVGYPEEMRGKISLPEFQTHYLPSEERVQAVFDWSFQQGIIEKELKASDIISEAGIN